MELSLTSLHCSLIHWGAKYPEINVICDDSKPLLDDSDVVKLSGSAAKGLKIITPDVGADYRVVDFGFGESHINPSIQLADLFASAAAYSLNKKDAFWDDIVDEHPEAISQYNLLPSKYYIDHTNEQTYRNITILHRMIEESQRPRGFSLSVDLMRGLALIQSVDLDILIKSMSKESRYLKLINNISDQ